MKKFNELEHDPKAPQWEPSTHKLRLLKSQVELALAGLQRDPRKSAEFQQIEVLSKKRKECEQMNDLARFFFIAIALAMAISELFVLNMGVDDEFLQLMMRVLMGIDIFIASLWVTNYLQLRKVNREIQSFLNEHTTRE